MNRNVLISLTALKINASFSIICTKKKKNYMGDCSVCIPTHTVNLRLLVGNK